MKCKPIDSVEGKFPEQGLEKEKCKNGKQEGEGLAGRVQQEVKKGNMKGQVETRKKKG